MVKPLICGVFALCLIVDFSAGQEDPELPIDPNTIEQVAIDYKVQPDYIHLGTFALSPRLWDELVITKYDILPYWRDVEESGRESLPLSDNLTFDMTTGNPCIHWLNSSIYLQQLRFLIALAKSVCAVFQVDSR